MSSAEFRHRPVLLEEVVELLTPVPAGVVLDATVGGGGHALALLERCPHLEVLGLDRDADAVTAAEATLAPHRARVTLRHTAFDHLDAVCQELGIVSLSGTLFDLGVSSPQLDRPARGFSYRADGPLDMRMDRRQPLTAADVVNTWDQAALADLLRRAGDERFAGRIARALVVARPLATTGELAAVVRAAVPAPARRAGHPARRTFQALRIAVNDELGALERALDTALDRLAPGGRCVVISYHSGEDRLVKDRFRAAAGLDRPGLPGLPPPDAPAARFRLLARGATRPAPEEVAANPRAESARLRAVERLGAAA